MNSIRRAGGLPLLDRLDRLARTPWQRAFALGHRAWYMLQMADDQAALAIGQQALALALPLSDPTLVLRLRQRVATIEARLGQFEAARTQLASVEPQAAQHLSLEEQAEFHGNYAMLLDNMGCGHEALAQHRQAIALSEASGDHAQRSTHLANLAVNRLNAGDAAGALATVEEAAALVRTYELVGSSAAFVSVLRLQCARALGRYAQALAAADHALALLRTDNPARLPIVQVHLGHAWLDLGQPARAWQALQQAGESGRLPAHVEVRRQVLLARLLRERGQDAAPALAAAQRAVPPAGWPEAALMVELEDAVAASWPQARPALQALAERASRAGWAGSALAATLRLAERATGEDPALAASAAEAALRQADHAVPTMMCRAAVWAHAAAALAAANRSARAAAVADEGRRWLLDTARLEVDHLHREAFLERNPVHRQLLALAARLGVTSDAVVAPRA
jgi:tetratricopeptide (TPR) repeat protein